MQAIILAGGFGTRLKSEVGNVPKPMAPMAGRPFLCWLLEYMAGQGVRKTVLSLHYQAETIRAYFGNHYAGITLAYTMEETPLGTGGAICNALALLDRNKPIFALNGDSLVVVNYLDMLQTHYRRQRPLTIATREMPDCRRYSLLGIKNGQVQSYAALGTAAPGIISTGFYIVWPSLFDAYDMSPAFSFEQDFLAPLVPVLKPASHTLEGYFIDIGVPQDYARAQSEIPALLNKVLAA